MKKRHLFITFRLAECCFCSKCGSKIEANANFCEKCGNNLFNI